MKKSKKSPDGMTFLEHLDDLRKRLFHSFLAIVFTILPAWFFHEQIFDILARPINQYLPEGETLVVTRLPEAFIVYIKVSFLAAIFVASPYIFFSFGSSLLQASFREKRNMSSLLSSSQQSFLPPEAPLATLLFFPLPAVFSLICQPNLN